MRFAFKDREEVVLCCTSTFHRRYLDDLVQVMALPSGARIRLRYRKPYCAASIRAFGELPPAELPSLSILIVYVQFDNLEARYVPLRIGKTVDILTEGSVTYLEVELGDFVEHPLSADAFSAWIVHSSTDILPYKKKANDKPSGVFLQSLNETPVLHAGSGTDMWEKVAKQFLDNLESTRRLSYIFGFNVVRRSNRKPLTYSEGVLLAPAVAELDIHVRVLIEEELAKGEIIDPIGNIDTIVTHPQCAISTGKSLPIDAPRNIHVARLSTSIGLRKYQGTLKLTAKQICSNGTGEVDIARDSEISVEVPVKVGPSQPLRVLLIFAIAVGLGMHALDVGDKGFNWALGKAIAVGVTALIALYLGLKSATND